jgi:hypothetical protein
MSARRNHRWLVWLLPLLVLRAFVPAGFMLSWSGNDLQIVLCSGTGPATPLASEHIASDSAHHHHEGGESKIHENSLCPFAAAGFANVTQLEFVSILALLVGQDRFGFFTDPAPRSAQVATHRIRGPPLA